MASDGELSRGFFPAVEHGRLVDPASPEAQRAEPFTAGDVFHYVKRVRLSPDFKVYGTRGL